ncbi:hypothetical protein GH153_02140 [bacterium]|nr:hypothetical protein [bacterium]
MEVIAPQGVLGKEKINFVRDVDFRRKIITILRTKGQKKREIPIGVGISRLLLKQRKHPDSPYVFCYEDGRRIDSFRRAFGTTLKRSGIKGNCDFSQNI